MEHSGTGGKVIFGLRARSVGLSSERAASAAKGGGWQRVNRETE